MVDIFFEIGLWLIYGLGAFICWLLKGCRTKLTDEIEYYKFRNAIMSIIIFALIVFVVIKVQN